MRVIKFYAGVALIATTVLPNITQAAAPTDTVTITLPNGAPFTYPAGQPPIIAFDQATGVVRVTSPVNPNFRREFGASTGSSASSTGYLDSGPFDPGPSPTGSSFGQVSSGSGCNPSSLSAGCSTPHLPGGGGSALPGSSGTGSTGSTDVPEPETVGLLLLGLTGLMAARRTSRRRLNP
jgi:hypothetical protein